MYHHIKKLMYTVQVNLPDPRFGNMLLDQFGGANGELAAAMQYSIQGINCEDMACKDLLMDIGTKELSHLEIIGTLARMHLRPMKRSADAAAHDPLIAIAGGGGTRPARYRAFRTCGPRVIRKAYGTRCLLDGRICNEGRKKGEMTGGRTCMQPKRAAALADFRHQSSLK